MERINKSATNPEEVGGNREGPDIKVIKAGLFDRFLELEESKKPGNEEVTQED